LWLVSDSRYQEVEGPGVEDDPDKIVLKPQEVAVLEKDKLMIEAEIQSLEGKKAGLMKKLKGQYIKDFYGEYDPQLYPWVHSPAHFLKFLNEAENVVKAEMSRLWDKHSPYSEDIFRGIDFFNVTQLKTKMARAVLTKVRCAWAKI